MSPSIHWSMHARLAAIGLAALAGTSAACGGGGKEKTQAARPCPPAAAATSSALNLPNGFPRPSAVTYTGQKLAGPSTIVSGYYAGDIGAALDGWKTAFGATAFDVTKSEHEEVDAEVNFQGARTGGQVKLRQTCKDRTSVTITLRPE